MPYIPPDIVAKARETDLLTYLQNYEPQELVHFGGNTYCTKEHDSLKISDGKWCWFSQGIGGRSALDYLIKVKGIPFMQAVERIVGQTRVQPPVFVSEEKDIPSSISVCINLLYFANHIFQPASLWQAFRSSLLYRSAMKGKGDYHEQDIYYCKVQGRRMYLQRQGLLHC